MRWPLFIVTAFTVLAQKPAEFEVASVRGVDVSKLGDTLVMNLGTVRHDEISFGNATLNDCIRFAFSMPSEALIAGPDWIRSRHYMYDIVAKGPSGVTREQLQTMMRSLLGERFRLVTHHESRPMSYYAMTTARGGSKMETAADKPDDYRGTTYGGRIDSIMDMRNLAWLLSRFERERPIIDETGLKGLYHVKLLWDGTADSQSPSLFTAVSEQLGLRLQAKKGPLDVLVVDSADPIPEAN